ncbi:TlpA family protein disulfide reductase [Glycomyces tenuis]|uniref:TlpA family protein disulfide reductase n=1 Tax=Glycomyces tenuis TaxID=58116 RepID=UPI0003FC47D7|nr:TlpA disulfide reductase family protein [Glycomyces tenuis]
MLSAACARSDPRNDTQRSSEAVGDGTWEFIEPADRGEPVELSGELLDGASFDLAAWVGSVVVVNFWGSWCAPCREEALALGAAHQSRKDEGVEFLGVDLRDERDSAKAFMQRYEQEYPSLFDPAGETILAFEEIPSNVVPATLILDSELRVATVFRKTVTQRELESFIDEVLGEET